MGGLGPQAQLYSLEMSDLFGVCARRACAFYSLSLSPFYTLSLSIFSPFDIGARDPNTTRNDGESNEKEMRKESQPG